MPKSDLTQALTAIEPKTKAAKVREVMPVIEQRIAAGVRIADILKTLKDSGIDLTEATLKSYLYRYRRKHQAKTKGQQSASRTSHADTTSTWRIRICIARNRFGRNTNISRPDLDAGA